MRLTPPSNVLTGIDGRGLGTPSGELSCCGMLEYDGSLLDTRGYGVTVWAREMRDMFGEASIPP